MLGMTRVFHPSLAGVLSAYGMGLAEQIAMRESAVRQELTEAGIGEARAGRGVCRPRRPQNSRHRA